MKRGRLLWWVLAVVVLARLASLPLYPLTDTTEARYGEIGRKMLETGNWVTPQWDYGVPFWGKPPLSFWAAAATMAVFGVNEFGARVATLIASIATAALFLRWPHAPAPRGAASAAAALVLLSSVLGFLIAGAVATDVFMTFGMTLSMVAFWRAVTRVQPGGSDGWWFFAGLAIGLLAKGPVAVVMTGIALFLWLLWARDWRRMWRMLPWLRGIVLTVALALPWYLLAERATPGFLHYFIIGEHWQRFTQPGWTGDLYGGGHERARGAIWLYAFGSALPWAIAVLALLRRKPVSAQAQRPSPDAQIAYLVCWMLAPLLLFTMARNILESYALPALPAFALLASRLFMEREPKGAASPAWMLGLIMPVVVAGLIVSGSDRFSDARSQRKLLAPLRDAGVPIVYLYERPFSGQFYSGGRALLAKDDADISQWLVTDKPAIVLLPQGRYELLGLARDPRWTLIGRHEGFVMLEHRPAQ